MALPALAGAICLAASPLPLTGMWGAGDALLALDAQGGRLQAGCRLARFAAFERDAQGRFSTPAQVETLSTRLPEESDEPSAPRPATLSGRIDGGVADLVLAVDGEPPRRLRLALGQRGTPARCL